MLVRYTSGGGTLSYISLDNLASTGGTWQTYTKTITPPAGTTAMTLFHLIAGNGQLTIDDVSVMGPGTTTPPSDTVLPVVSITAPTSSSTVNGTVAVALTATDNIGVTGVTLLIDGNPVGSPDGTAPYTFSWNSASVTNGIHTISARATDAAGNLGVATAITVTVNNVVTPPATSTNLVTNGNFETAGPAGWSQGGWGTNTRTFTYPTPGFSGNGARVTISGYTSGDAKWYFTPVTVTPGTAYTISERYNSTVASQMLVRYTSGGGTLSYISLDNLASTGGTWQTYTKTITPPAGTTAMTLFHLIAGNGQLTIDDVSVMGPGTTTPPSDTVLPVVSITAPTSSSTVNGTVAVALTATDNIGVTGVTLLIDGNPVGSEDTTVPYSFNWDTTAVSNGTHVLTVRARDAAGNLGISAAVTVTVSNSTSTVDTESPTVSVTAPTNAAVLSGTTTIQVTAGDNVGVTGVNLVIDGGVVGTTLTSAPYTFTLNTETLTNGAHTIAARAVDAMGNVGMATVVNVTVSNTVTPPPPGPNLIQNSDLETVGVGGNPQNWNRAGWGTNTHTHTYPVAGQSGNGAEVAMTSYTDGDARWMFDDVAITPGTTYTYGYAYIATVPTKITLRYTRTNGTYLYIDAGTPGTSASWTTGSLTLVPPTGVTSVTIMHLIEQVGTLTIDNQSLSTGG